MRLPGLFLRLSPATVVLGAAASAAILVSLAPMTHANIRMDCPASSICTTPTPVNAFITLDVTAGGANVGITVNGSSFLAGETINLYWDTASHVAGATTANSGGSFSVVVKPFAGDSPGLHRICVTEPPGPCANFTLQGPPTPTPPPTPSPSASPSGSETPGEPATPSRLDTTPTSFDILKPPFVFMPIIGGLFLLAAIAYWTFSLARNAALRPRTPNLPAASVVHRATRPDYAAGFGTAPSAPAEPAPPQSAWADVLAPTPPPVPPAEAAELASEPSAPELPSPPDEPPDLPEPGD